MIFFKNMNFLFALKGCKNLPLEMRIGYPDFQLERIFSYIFYPEIDEVIQECRATSEGERPPRIRKNIM